MKRLYQSNFFSKENLELNNKDQTVPKFNGKLKKEELEKLRSASISEKKIKKIERLLYMYKDHLTGFQDLVGDTGIPSNLFYFNMKHFGYLLEDEAERVINSTGVFLRKYTTGQLIRHLGPLFLTSKQIFEKRSELLKESNKIDERLEVPQEPVLWTPNHHFKDDALATIIAEKRPAYMVFGSLPEFYNTFNGILAFLEGALIINRKIPSSRKAIGAKVKRALSLKADVFYCPEGVWNKCPNKLLLDCWRGIYKIAVETGTKIIPIIHYVYDPSRIIDEKLNPIHTVIDDPIDLTKFSEEVGLRYYRDVMATWYYLMLEKYGQTTREKLLEYYTQRAMAYSDLKREDFVTQPLTSHEAWEIYLTDLRKTAERYDSSIELSADYRPQKIVRPEDVFTPISRIQNVTPQNVRGVLDALELIKIREQEDYQRRF